MAGGIRNREQHFSAAGARIQSTLLSLAAVGLIVPAAFHHSAGPSAALNESSLSVMISFVLLGVYGLGLFFSLHTHKHLFAGHQRSRSEKNQTTGPAYSAVHNVWPMRKALIVLVSATACVAWISEILVGTVEHAASSMGMSEVFVGVVVVAVIGNAAEHSTAVLMALKNRMIPLMTRPESSRRGDSPFQS